jgi:isoquinoline 1-oxidoreductase subunit beta
VKLLWSREEDMTKGWYHPVTQCKIVAGFDADNNLTAIHYRISGQSILATVAPARMQEGRDPATFSGFYPGGAEAAFGYSIPNILVDHSMRNPHIRPAFWRGVNINHNAIYIECFMDELAKEVGMDALEFRRKLMGTHPKHLAVLNAVAEKAGWGKPAPAEIHRGLAQAMVFGSYVAACAEISVDGNKVRVHRIVAATDPGYAVNPAQIERQVAGSFVYGLTGLFFGGCTVKNGRIEQENFDSYDMMRIKEMPKVETIIMPSGGFWGGVGEPTICVAAPAVLNAIAAATGTRYRTFPLRDHGLVLV